MRRTGLCCLCAVMLVFMAGCGSQSQVVQMNSATPSAQGVPVALTVTDAPPAGVAVLFFQLNTTSAALMSSSGGSVPLLSSGNPVPVNVSQLQTDAAFLGNQSVAAGTYNSLSLTFANPQLTIFNGSGEAIGDCANNSVCQLTPTATPLTVTFNTAPFPVTLTANSPLAFKLDIHLDTVIQPDLTVNLAAANGVTVSELAPSATGAPIPALGHVTGTIQSVTSNGFTLTTLDGRTLTLVVNGSTTYNYPTSVCSTDNFACLANTQSVRVAVSLESAGALLATDVDYVQASAQTTVEGNIIRLSTSNGSTLMDLVVQRPPIAASAVLSWGQRVTVTVPPAGVNYAVDTDGFNLPGGVIFASAANLMVGQEVLVVIEPGATLTPASSDTVSAILDPAATTFTASSITLEPMQMTGLVNGSFPINISGLNFVISTLANFFVPPAATAAAPPVPAPINLAVQATSATTFQDLNPDGMAGLAAGDVVSVQGWLFPYAVVPQFCIGGGGCAPMGEIVAENIIGRPGPTPLF